MGGMAIRASRECNTGNRRRADGKSNEQGFEFNRHESNPRGEVVVNRSGLVNGVLPPHKTLVWALL